MAEHKRTPFTIFVRSEVFNFGFEVIVEPAPDGIGHDREFRWLADARRYAERLSKSTGWPVRDQVEMEA